MRKFTVVVRDWENKPFTVTGYKADNVDYLVATPSMYAPGKFSRKKGWVITHVRSGCTTGTVKRFDTLKDAIRAIEAVDKHPACKRVLSSAMVPGTKYLNKILVPFTNIINQSNISY